MIINFGDSATEAIYNGVTSRKSRKIPGDIIALCQRKLDMINSAINIRDLKVPPGNRLEALSGKRKGFYSIRINKQYRIIFRFSNGNSAEVEIVDYH